MTTSEYPRISPTVAPQIEALALTAANVEVDGQNWKLYRGDSQPFIRDLDWAERLGFSRPRDVRPLIKRMAEAGRLGEVVCGAASQTRGSVGGRPSVTYYLTKGQALKVAAKSETEFADKVLDQMVQAFLLLERGQVALAPVVAAQPAPVAADSEPAWVGRLTERLDKQAEVFARSMETIVGAVLKRLDAPQSAPALPPAAEWVNTANLCAQLGLSVSALNKKLRLRDKKAVDSARRWTRTDGYHWNVEAMRVLLRGPIPQRTWEPPAPAPSVLPAKVDDHGLRKSIVLYVQEACKRLGKESSEDRRTIWRDLYSAYGLRSGSDPMAEARKGEKSLDVIERNKDLSTFLAICMERLPAGKEHYA